MHLTRLRLDPRSSQVRRDLANPYDMHRTLARAFVDGDQAKPARFLWRLEIAAAWEKPMVLVQSASQGNWQPLLALPRYLAEDPATNEADLRLKQVDVARLLQVEGRYRFRLQANPTVTRQGKRLGLCKEEEQLAWLARQGAQHGFVVENALVSDTAMLQGRKGEMRLSVMRASFDGYLRVTDAERVSALLVNGLGHAKALGCGLLSVSRV